MSFGFLIQRTFIICLFICMTKNMHSLDISLNKYFLGLSERYCNIFVTSSTLKMRFINHPNLDDTETTIYLWNVFSEIKFLS